MKRKNTISYLKTRLKDNGGKWLGSKFGNNDEVVVRIRRNSGKHFYLIVEKFIAENKVMVRDARGKEHGVAIRFDKDSFALEPDLT